jgi:ribosomal protein L13E
MRSKRTEAMLAAGPIDLVGRKAEPMLAKGYSALELERAGLSIAKARSLGLPVDPERTSGVGANVLRLRQYMASR